MDSEPIREFEVAGDFFARGVGLANIDVGIAQKSG
jgi:hypothetical protein